MKKINQRIEELELRNAYQEDTINQLNDIVFEQQKSLDKFSLTLKSLQARILSLSEETTVSPTMDDEKPPHY